MSCSIVPILILNALASIESCTTIFFHSCFSTADLAVTLGLVDMLETPIPDDSSEATNLTFGYIKHFAPSLTLQMVPSRLLLGFNPLTLVASQCCPGFSMPYPMFIPILTFITILSSHPLHAFAICPVVTPRNACNASSPYTKIT